MSQPAICCSDHFRRSLRAVSWHKGSLNANLHNLGRVAQSQADIASETGLERAEAVAVLADQRFADAVRKAEKFWTQQGISGVPAIVFDRKHLVTGAQGADNYTNILTQLTQSSEAAVE